MPDRTFLRRARARSIAVLAALVVGTILVAAAGSAQAQATGGKARPNDQTAASHAEKKLAKGKSQKIELPEQAFAATFDGRDAKEDLTLRAEKLPEAATASAQSETHLVPLAGSVTLKASTDDGKSVISFPHTVEIVPATVDQPGYVKSFKPAIELVTKIDAARIAGMERSSIAMYTREAPGSPWVRLPSAYDPKAGVVVAHSDHLSEFIVMGAAASTATGPRVVLDTDDDVGHALWNGTTQHEVTYNVKLANALAPILEHFCGANVLLTRPNPADQFVSRDLRRTMADDHNPDLTVTLAFNAFTGFPWGVQNDGGVRAWAQGSAANTALAQEFLNRIPQFTGRPSTLPVQGDNGLLPYDEFDGLAGAYAHVEVLFLDHNYDWPVIDTAFDLVVNGAAAAITTRLRAAGFNCSNPDDPNSGFPQPPSAERLQQLRNLGYQSFLRYGAEPVSMSTGNFSTAEKTFSLSGVGNQTIDLTLDYNAQSGQDAPVGVGWQFVYGSFLQQYRDGSVLVNLADGRALRYVPDGSGGFTTPLGAFAALTKIDAATFRWSSSTGTSMTFRQDARGRGMLASSTDRQGNTETLTYNGAGALFPKLADIADQAGQHVIVTTNGDGRITGFTRPDGAVWQLGYSAAGDLISITSALGTIRRFNYDDQHRMTSEVGQDGVTFLTNAYDTHSRVVRQTNAFGQIRTLAFDDAGRTTTYTDTTGAVTVYKWNELGQVTKVVDAMGGVTQTAYSPEMLPTGETDQLGHTTTKGYDASGQVASVNDPLGHVASSTYNGTGDLTSATDSGGANGGPRTVSYSLNDDGLPTTITNPDGTTLRRAYNAAGDITSAIDENGAATAYAYDPRGNTTTVTDPLGRITTMTYDAANRLSGVTDPLGHTTSYVYDANDNLTQTSYPNGSTEKRTYDVNDQLASSTDRRGGITTYSRDAELNLVAVKLPNGGVIRHTFDNEDRLTSTTDPLGNITHYGLDALGRVVTTTNALGNSASTSYDAAGTVTAQTDESGATTAFVRDANGRVLKATDPAGGVTGYAWDAVGRQVSSSDQLGHQTSRTYNFRNQVVAATDPAGGVTTNSYDAAGRLVKQTDPVGAVTTFAYDSAGQLVKQTDALGGVTTYTYDAAGNRTSLTDADGHTTSTSYDVMNEPVTQKDGNGNVTNLQLDAGGLVLAQTDPLGHKTTYGYDSVGKVVSTTDALNRTTKLGYDLNGRQVTQTDPDGVVTTDKLDGVGNLTAVVRNTRAGEPANATVNVTNTYAYDVRNLLTSATDPNGGVTKYGYNSRGLLTTSTDPLGKATTYGYDAAGNRGSRTDANGVVTNYGYDPRNLLLQRAYPDGTKDTFGYDAASRQTSAVNPTGAVTTSYDLLGRATQVGDAAGQTLKYTYDAAGNRTALTLPDGRGLAYSYDANNQLTKLDSPLGTLTMTYDAAGRPTSVGRPNGTTTTVGFDNANELTQLVTKAGSSTLASFAYGYDAAGNVGTRNQTLGNDTSKTTYTYDPLRRLTADKGGPLPSTYTYDAAGNRLTWSASDDPLTPKPNDPFVQTNAFNAAGELTSSTMVRQNGGTTKTDVTTDSYDNNGNRLKADTIAPSNGQSTSTVYTYDFNNRLLTSVPGNTPQKGNGDGQRNYSRSYDALGRLVTETHGTTATTWTEDGLNPIVAKDSATTLYLRDVSGSLEGEQTSTSDPAWYVTDALGSILGSTNSKAKLANTTTYSDYGLNIGSSNFRMGFGGEIADPLKPGNGIGNDTPVLSQYYARSYDPSTGSWLQRDSSKGSLTAPDSMSAYQFAADDPSSHRDLYGYVTDPNSIYLGSFSGPWLGLQGGAYASLLQTTASPQATVNGTHLQQTADSNYLQPTASPFAVARYPRCGGTQSQLAVTIADLGIVNFAVGASGPSLSSISVRSTASRFTFLGGTPFNPFLRVSDFFGGLRTGATQGVSGYVRASGTIVPDYDRFASGVAPLLGEATSASHIVSLSKGLGVISLGIQGGLVVYQGYQTYQANADLPSGERKLVTGAVVANRAGSVASGALGAIGGAELGLFCGPAAIVCSPVGAVIGGLAGSYVYDQLTYYILSP